MTLCKLVLTLTSKFTICVTGETEYQKPQKFSEHTKVSTKMGTSRPINPVGAPRTYIAWWRQRYIICLNLPLHRYHNSHNSNVYQLLSAEKKILPV